ncbi:MAG: hypothetical protein SGI92_15680 [Bryobacteraceae bacterium]|nr:hypothetical protein [Bryobacteraceae bacterium]
MRALPAFLIAFSLACSAVDLPSVVTRTGAVRTESVPLTKLDNKHQYSLLYSLAGLKDLTPASRVLVEVRQGDRILAGKTLHAGDPDFYTQFIATPGTAEVRIRVTAAAGQYKLQVNAWPLSDSVRRGPIRTWQDAMPIKLGSTVFASGDDAQYVPLPGTARKAGVEDEARIDWYKFEFTESRPKLIYFQVDLTERDQIPVNITVHRVEAGKLAEYYEGEDPVTLPHEVQALPGNKFTPRILKQPGTYYIAVRASHPEYKLRTRVYDPPPYDSPEQAVATAVDYALGAGDSWHANTPRRGGVLDRVASVHQETSLCVACHATHFTQRAQLYATRNGYPVVQRQQLQFLSERFYNNPRPFFGFEEQGAVWSRMISAAANVLSRMSHLMSLYETEVSGDRHESFHKGVAEYLKLYYDGRDKLPGDETNGNTPLVSAHEVGWYSWGVTKDPKLGDMIAKGEVKNTIDLCYQTLALADIDKAKYKAQIDRNAERLISLQRPDGQWSARFDVKEPVAEFQTGHALWALYAAGVPKTNPGVAKGLAYLLKRQQEFGGWMDPLQSFENFRTPFRETQMSVIALSSYYPKPGRANGWNSPAITSLSKDPVELLRQLDNVWDRPSPKVVQAIVAETHSNDAMIRQAAVEALSRLRVSVPATLLGDASKMVQRTAARAVRLAKDNAVILAALSSKDDRTRWASTRVFAQHFSELARNEAFAPKLTALLDDTVPSIRMGATKAAWQFWFWTPSTPVKSGIEDAVLTALGKPQHPWVRENLQHAVYNIADENIRYLYNNWVPGLAHAEDRERVVKGRLSIEARLADKFAAVLDKGTAEQKKLLLRSLTEFPLRRADIYDLEADLGKQAPPVYNRIGNDIEQIAFFGQSAEKMSTALRPLLDGPDPETRRLAAQAVLMVRDQRFGDVSRVAGPSGDNAKWVTAKVQTMPEAIEVARALKPPAMNVAATGSTGAPKRRPRLDEAFFRGYVQPILEKRGKDGQACVHCHASHTLFNATYGTVYNVVDGDEPEKSLILVKPTSTAESEGIANANSVAHGGGVRWTKDSPEYTTILEWIKGAKE